MYYLHIKIVFTQRYTWQKFASQVLRLVNNRVESTYLQDTILVVDQNFAMCNVG